MKRANLVRHTDTVKSAGFRPFGLLLIFLVASSGPCRAESALSLSPIDPKPFYKPGDRIVLEMRCGAGVTGEAVVMYNPTLGGDDGFLLDSLPKCPLSRFQIEIPRNFIGKNQVTALIGHLNQTHGAIFEFEVRSDAQPSDLRLSSDWQSEGCSLSIFQERPAPLSIYLYSVLPDGTRFDLCREGKATVVTDSPDHGVFEMRNGFCTVTPKKAGSFKIIATYRGLRKEWTCSVSALEGDSRGYRPSRPDVPEIAAARPKPPPARKISVEEFLTDPTRLDRHPAQVGLCRTVEHWDTGYCYVFSEGRGKVSAALDERCDNLSALRDRMERAIRGGFCDARAPDAAMAKLSEPAVRKSDRILPGAYVVPAAGAPGSPPRISIPAFRNDPRKLDRHPMDVGQCRLVEHHTTGYCYVYSLPDSRKVSELTDARCTELDELRRRMRTAIDEGHCGIPANAGTPPVAAPGSTGSPQVKKTMSDMRTIAISAEAYAVDHADYPVAPDVPALARRVEPNYMPAGATPLVDAWGTPFAYVCDGKEYRIVSAGADRSFEPDSTSLKAPPAGETGELARDLIFSNGRFIQWPTRDAR